MRGTRYIASTINTQPQQSTATRATNDTELLQSTAASSQQPPQSGEQRRSEKDFGLFSISRDDCEYVKPYNVMVTVNGEKVKMEIDSRAAMSIMSQKMYEKRFSRFKLRSSEVVLKDCSGKVIPVIGEMDVTVKCGDQVLKSVLIVSEGNSPTLKGRNWIRYLTLDWSQVNHVACPVEQLCDKYSEV